MYTFLLSRFDQPVAVVRGERILAPLAEVVVPQEPQLGRAEQPRVAGQHQVQEGRSAPRSAQDENRARVLPAVRRDRRARRPNRNIV